MTSRARKRPSEWVVLIAGDESAERDRCVAEVAAPAASRNAVRADCAPRLLEVWKPRAEERNRSSSKSWHTSADCDARAQRAEATLSARWTSYRRPRRSPRNDICRTAPAVEKKNRDLVGDSGRKGPEVWLWASARDAWAGEIAPRAPARRAQAGARGVALGKDRERRAPARVRAARAPACE